MECLHQFIKIRDIGNRVAMKGYGIVVGCAICGNIRTIWENGEIEISNPDNEQPSPT